MGTYQSLEVRDLTVKLQGGNMSDCLLIKCHVVHFWTYYWVANSVVYRFGSLTHNTIRISRHNCKSNLTFLESIWRRMLSLQNVGQNNCRLSVTLCTQYIRYSRDLTQYYRVVYFLLSGNSQRFDIPSGEHSRSVHSRSNTTCAEKGFPWHS